MEAGEFVGALAAPISGPSSLFDGENGWLLVAGAAGESPSLLGTAGSLVGTGTIFTPGPGTGSVVLMVESSGLVKSSCRRSVGRFLKGMRIVRSAT